MAISNTAQALRVALKAAGYNARRVTVRESYSSFNVTIRDAAVSLSAVEAIANKFSVVRRCEKTGEILSGGNTFVNVAYADELVAPVQAAIIVVLRPAAEDEWVTALGDFRALKVSRQRGATYPDEVRIEGRASATATRWRAVRSSPRSASRSRSSTRAPAARRPSRQASRAPRRHGAEQDC